MHTTRRQFLAATAAVGAAGLAGCSALGGGDDPGQAALLISVRNRSGEAQTIDVRVTDSEGELYEEFTEETVPADVSRAYDVSGPGEGRYTVSIQGPDWSTAGTWTPEFCADSRFVTTLEREDGRPSVTATTTCEDDA